MKILMITPYVTITSRPELSRNKTGFGYMVYDIANAIGKIEQVDVLCTDSRGEGFKDGNVFYIKRSLPLLLKAIGMCLIVKKMIKLLQKYKMQRGSAIRLFYYWLMTGYLASILHKGNYDIVHIHGCSFATELWMNICRKYNQRFVVTLHGLNSFSDTVKLETAGKQYERDFLKRVVDGEIPITVISTGMKRLIEKVYDVEDCSSITVVCNSFSFNSEAKIKNDVRSLYRIPQDAFVILYVGNISKNKNQKQMIEAFGLLPEKLQESTYVMFCGIPNESCQLEQMIANQPHGDHLILCGSVEKNDMPSYYRQADGVVLLSFTEGFGLSLIEGMHFGVPCVMPLDLDSFEDIVDDIAVIAIENRSNRAVANAMVTLHDKKWDREAIIKYSIKFDRETMAHKYIIVYKSLISQ